MHCAACANRNELSLKKLPGVVEAAVNFAMRSARVEFDPSQVSERTLHEAVAENGFQVLSNELAKDNKAREVRELNSARLRAFTALALAAPVMLLVSCLANQFIKLPSPVAMGHEHGAAGQGDHSKC
jgi:Cu+-exporting ATPase